MNKNKRNKRAKKKAKEARMRRTAPKAQERNPYAITIRKASPESVERRKAAGLHAEVQLELDHEDKWHAAECPGYPSCDMCEEGEEECD